MNARFAALLSLLLLLNFASGKAPVDSRSKSPKPPRELSVSFYQSAAQFEDIDDRVWLYLCDLIPTGNASHREHVAKMLRSISLELRRYYLTRLFDWERASGGLESCFMREEDDLFLDETLAAYEHLGAKEHAQIIRALRPLAKKRTKEIEEADAKGNDFNYDDGFWEPWEEKWEAASKRLDFYSVIFSDMKAHPERYLHKR